MHKTQRMIAKAKVKNGGSEGSQLGRLLEIYRPLLSRVARRRHVVAERRRVTQQETGSVTSHADGSPSPSSQAVASEKKARLLDAILLLDPKDQSIVNETCTAEASEENAILAVAISDDDRWTAWGGRARAFVTRPIDVPPLSLVSVKMSL